MTAAEQSGAALAPIAVTVDQVASGFGVTEKTVRSWIREGLEVLKAGGKGRGNGAQLDLWAVIDWYLAENALDVAKTRLASAQADRHEMENATRRRELADITAVEKEWTGLVMAFRSRMLALPSKLGPQLINVADPAITAARIRAEVNTALVELAAGGGEPAGAAGASGAKGSAAAGSNGKRVGRQIPAPVKRKQRGAGTLQN